MGSETPRPTESSESDKQPSRTGWAHHARALLGAVAAGVLFGASTVVLNNIDHPVLKGAASVVGAASGWAAAGLLFGWFAFRTTASLRHTIVLSTLFFLGATFSYYVVDHVYSLARYATLPPELLANLRAESPHHGGPPELSVAETLLWSIASLVCGPICALVGGLAHRPGVVGLLARLSLPSGLAAWSGHLLTSPAVQLNPAYLVAHVVTVVASGALAVVLAIQYFNQRRASMASLATVRSAAVGDGFRDVRTSTGHPVRDQPGDLLPGPEASRPSDRQRDNRTAG